MPKKSLEALTESMFYVLMAFQAGPRCGIDVAGYIEERTAGRIKMGPATLYTILGKFQEVGFLREIAVSGRKRTYELTAVGYAAYAAELERLNACLRDAQAAARDAALRGGDGLGVGEEDLPLSPAPLPAL